MIKSFKNTLNHVLRTVRVNWLILFI